MECSGNKYADHIMESYGRHYLENEHGFITWQKLDNSVVINTLYVVPELRKEHRGSELADHVAGWAKEAGAKSLLCEIDTRSKTYDQAYKAITSYGFQIRDWIGSYVILEKDL